MITAKQFIDYLYYKCLPTEWTSQDMNIYPVAPFYRYLQALVGYSYKDPYTDEEGNLITQHVGGFEQVINKANEFNNLIDPDTCPYEFFPYLYQSFGLNYDKVIETKTTDDGETIPIYYHRKFLKNIGELMKRRGTMSGLRYLVRVLTGLDFVYTYERKENGRFLHINLQLKSIQDKALSEEYLKVLEHFLTLVLPHYIHFEIGSSIAYSGIFINKLLRPTTTYTVEYNLKSVDMDADIEKEE